MWLRDADPRPQPGDAVVGDRRTVGHARLLAGGRRCCIPNSRAPEAEVERAVDTVGAVALVRPEGIRALDGATRCEPDAAFVQWTSGTTGDAKAILHTHAAYLELLDRVLGELRSGSSSGQR